MIPSGALGSSFRDPAGFVFENEGEIFRAVTELGRGDYDRFMASGLYDRLTRDGWLVPHRELPSKNGQAYKILAPELITFISYPYEWCFSQLKDAALRMLEIQLAALEHGMSLKDANPFNIQWKEGRPILIDTLSFEPFQERPWFAYRQFCETFLAPLAMMAYVKADFNRYLTVDLNGVDLGFCSRTLPFWTRFNAGCLAHIHIHAWSQKKFSARADATPAASLQFSKNRMVSLIRSLQSAVSGLRLAKRKTIFGDYYGEYGHYSDEAEVFKAEKVTRWGTETRPKRVLDLGGNNGKFSRIFTQKGSECVCADADPFCVEENYRLSKAAGDTWMMPVSVDLSNPPHDLGWDGRERTGFFKRVRADLVLALALVHHLRITNNVPLVFLAEFFSRCAPTLLIEFVPKGDSMVQKLLANRDDVFHDYEETEFETVFGRHYAVLEKSRIPHTQRTLYFLRRR